MATLRSNVVVTIGGLIVVGLIRPGFSAIVNRVFGAEVNGHIATLLALLVVAALPATAGLPTAVVRYASRAYAAGDRARAAAYARLAAWLCVGLWFASVLGLFAYSASSTARSMSLLEIGAVAFGVAGYSYWRLVRSLMVSAGIALESLYADVLSLVAMVGAVGATVYFREERYLVLAWCGVYVGFFAYSLPIAAPLFKGGTLDRTATREFLRLTVLWFIGTASSLALREVTVLVLDEGQTPDALIGELSVGLTLLMLLGFAPRAIELPLVHELAAQSGRPDKQNELTSLSVHWITLIVWATCVGAAVLARPILLLVGGIETPEIGTAFALLSIGYSTELALTPATNLLAADAEPESLAVLGAVPFLAAALYWAMPFGRDLMGVVYGIMFSYGVKMVAICLWMRRYPVDLFRRPLEKLIALGAGIGAVVWALGAPEVWAPYAAFLGFELVMVVVFRADLFAMSRAFLGRTA